MSIFRFTQNQTPLKYRCPIKISNRSRPLYLIALPFLSPHSEVHIGDVEPIQEAELPLRLSVSNYWLLSIGGFLQVTLSTTSCWVPMLIGVQRQVKQSSTWYAFRCRTSKVFTLIDRFDISFISYTHVNFFVNNFLINGWVYTIWLWSIIQLHQVAS